MEWINPTQDGDKWQAVVNTIMDLRVSTKCGEFLSQLINCQLLKEGPFSMELYMYLPVTEPKRANINTGGELSADIFGFKKIVDQSDRMLN